MCKNRYYVKIHANSTNYHPIVSARINTKKSKYEKISYTYEAPLELPDEELLTLPKRHNPTTKISNNPDTNQNPVSSADAVPTCLMLFLLMIDEQLVYGLKFGNIAYIPFFPP